MLDASVDRESSALGLGKVRVVAPVSNCLADVNADSSSGVREMEGEGDLSWFVSGSKTLAALGRTFYRS